jgi:hypothetical protein
MIQFLNQYHKKFLAFIFCVVAVAFSVWGPATCKGTGEQGSIELGGQNYGEAAKQEALATLTMARSIGWHTDATDQQSRMMAMYMSKSPLGSLAQLMAYAGTGKRNRAEQKDGQGIEELATLVTLREQAKKLGVEVSQDEIDKEVKNSSRFQTNGQYDPAKFDAMFKNSPNRNIAEKQLFTVYRDALCLQKISKLVSVPIEASDFAVEAAYNRQNAILTTQVVTLPHKEHEGIKAEEKDAKEFYDSQIAKKDAERDASITSPASKNIQYVLLAMSDRTEDISKLDAKAQEEKQNAWKAQDTKANTTAEELYDLAAGVDAPDEKGMSLDAAVQALLAKYTDKNALAPIELKTFANFHGDNVPEELKKDRRLAMTIAASTKALGSYKMQNGSHLIFEVVKKNDAAPLPFAEIKDKLIEKLTEEKIEAAVTEKFNTVRNTIETALKANKSWADALTEAKVTSAELVINPSKQNPSAPAYQSAVSQAAATLKSNAVAANAVPSEKDKLLVYLQKREIMDSPKAADDKKQMKDSQGIKPVEGQLGKLFNDWFELKREETYPLYQKAV